jgi:ankyrin repeat protein
MDSAPQDVNEVFMQAAQAGHLEQVKLLISNPNLSVWKLNTALHEATKNGHAETVQFILSDPRVSFGIKFATNTAVAQGNVELAKILVTDPRNHPSTINESFVAAARNGYMGIFTSLYSDPRVNAQGYQEALSAAASSGRTEIFKILFNDPRVGPSSNPNVLLREASFGNHYDIANILLHRLDVNPHFAQFVHPDEMSPKRAETIKLAQTAREFHHNIFEEFLAKSDILSQLSKEELDMLLTLNRNNRPIFMYLSTFTSLPESIRGI